MQDQPPSVPEPFRRTWTGRRLERLVQPRLEPGEALVGWSRAWVSRDGRANWLEVRNRDFVVLTDRRLMFWSTGFLTRRPRRRVLLDRLDQCEVEPVGRHPSRAVRVRAFARPPLRLELSRRSGDAFVRELAERVAEATRGTVPPLDTPGHEEGRPWRP